MSESGRSASDTSPVNQASTNEAHDKAVFCGDGCACLTVCGDFYEHSWLPRPPERSCRHGCNGCDECTDE